MEAAGGSTSGSRIRFLHPILGLIFYFIQKQRFIVSETYQLDILHISYFIGNSRSNSVSPNREECGRIFNDVNFLDKTEHADHPNSVLVNSIYGCFIGNILTIWSIPYYQPENNAPKTIYDFYACFLLG